MNNPFDKESWTEQEKEIINAGGWQCSFCGSINAAYVTSCACGHNQDDSYENLHGRYVPRPDEEYTEQPSIGETVASASAVAEVEPAFEEIPAAPTEPAFEEIPATPEEPAFEEIPAAPTEPAFEEIPAAPTEPAFEEIPATPEEPVFEEIPATPEEPVFEEIPATPEEPAFEEIPTAPEEPAFEEIPSAPAEETPAGIISPFDEEIPEVLEESVSEEIPSAPAEETPAGIISPFDEEIPAVSEEPASEEMSSTPVEPAFEEIPSVPTAEETVAEETTPENTAADTPEPAPATPSAKKPVSKTNRPIEEYPEYEQGILNDGGWECAFCERINANYITTCACGHSEDDSFLKRRGKYVNPETGEVEPAPAAPEAAPAATETAAPAATETAAPAAPTPAAPEVATPAAELTPADMIAEIEQELAADSSEMAKFRAIRKYKNLVKKGYMTKEEFNKKQDELLSFEDDDAMAAPESSGEDNA